ncbi:hypothetical protein SHXM_01759 [Streptomyces hygroscopicus]|nr:hypothetical protein SHXM_01759 [Streptomyces hygroscopicus]
MHELKRLARNAAELMTLSADLQAGGIQLELLTGPLTGIYDPNGIGAKFFAVLAAAGQIERSYIREKTLEGQVIAASKGNHGGRPKVIVDDMLTFAVALKDKGVPVPEIAKKLTIKVGKNAGKSPSVASLYRALAEAEAAAVDEGLPLRPKPVRIRQPGEPLRLRRSSCANGSRPSRTRTPSCGKRACLTLAERCVAGITANEERLRAAVENSIGLVTALNPHIGYEAATGIAKEALETGRGVAELVLEKGLLPAERPAALLRPEVLAGSGSPSL